MAILPRTASPDVTLTVSTLMYDDSPLRVVMLDGEPWFMATELARLTGNRLVQALAAVKPDEKLAIPNGRLREGKTHLYNNDDAVYLISTSGAFHLALSWRRDLQRWLTREVLPTLYHKTPPSAESDLLPLRRQKRVRVTKSPADAEKKRQSLYRFFDAEGELLYVGITWNLPNRMRGHRQTQPWWTEVDNITIEPYSTRSEAHEAEAVAIAEEKPRYNVIGVA